MQDKKHYFNETDRIIASKYLLPRKLTACNSTEITGDSSFVFKLTSQHVNIVPASFAKIFLMNLFALWGAITVFQ
jgi:hypothetical protein